MLAIWLVCHHSSSLRILASSTDIPAALSTSTTPILQMLTIILEGYSRVFHFAVLWQQSFVYFRHTLGRLFYVPCTFAVCVVGALIMMCSFTMFPVQ